MQWAFLFGGTSSSSSSETTSTTSASAALTRREPSEKQREKLGKPGDVTKPGEVHGNSYFLIAKLMHISSGNLKQLLKKTIFGEFFRVKMMIVHSYVRLPEGKLVN